MTLIRDIQHGVSDSALSLPDLLRKTKILARRLRSEGLEAWTNHELNGYPDDVELPPYRIIHTESYGWFENRVERRKMRIPTEALPDNQGWREMATTVRYGNPIMYFHQLLAAQPEVDENLGSVWPMAAVSYVQQNVPIYSNGFVLQNAWRVVTREDFATLVDNVRTRLLDFALDIEQLNPDAGEAGPGDPPPVDRQTINQVINNTIFAGGSQTVAIGSSDFDQSGPTTVVAGDLDSLHQALRVLGVASSDLDLLDHALTADPKPTKAEGIGPKTRQWIQDTAGNLGDGAAQWGGGVIAAHVLSQIETPIRQFLGIG